MWFKWPILRLHKKRRENSPSIESAKKGSILFSRWVQISGLNCSRTRKCSLNSLRDEWLQFPVEVQWNLIEIPSKFNRSRFFTMWVHCKLKKKFRHYWIIFFPIKLYSDFFIAFSYSCTIEAHYFQVGNKKRVRAIKMKYLLCSHH